MNYAALGLDAALASVISPQGKPASARRDHAAYETYLDAADALGDLLEAGEIKPHQRPSIDKRGPLWWVTHNA